ncbi:MAG: acyl-CoA dehydrogenase family protein [Deltaproteobacteria bacterium]|nr:acyl-CoA dehydrogenase family protein [Deltaproteobacteria bacterium]
MDFMLSEEDRRFKHFCQDFAREKLVPFSLKYGETSNVPRDMVAEMESAGIFELLLPEELGGKGVRSLPVCLAREAFAGVYCPADVTLAMQGLGGYPIYLAGTREQQEKYLVPVGRGDLLTTYALTEPAAGSDVNAMKSEARADEKGFVLNGEKVFISNGYAADILVTFCRTPLPGNPRGMSAFILEKGMDGLRVAERLSRTRMFLSPATTCWVTWERVSTSL